MVDITQEEIADKLLNAISKAGLKLVKKSSLDYIITYIDVDSYQDQISYYLVDKQMFDLIEEVKGIIEDDSDKPIDNFLTNSSWIHYTSIIELCNAIGGKSIVDTLTIVIPH